MIIDTLTGMDGVCNRVRVCARSHSQGFHDIVSCDSLRCRIVLWILSLMCCLGFGQAALGAAPSWKILETPRFTVVSQLSEAKTRAWADEFNRFIDTSREALTLDERLLPSLTVVIFSRDKDFRPYWPVRPNGKPWEVGGFFNQRETWAVIGMPDAWSDEATRHAIFHEGTHWLLSLHQKRLPLCISEGLAEVFSTFEVRNGRAVFGKAPESHFGLLQARSTQLQPLADLMLTGSGSLAFNSDMRTGRFYAQSWAFVHYLLFGDRKEERGSLDSFLNALAGEKTTEEAFRKTFGKASTAVDEDLRQYVTSGRYYTRSKPVEKNQTLGGKFVEASPERVEMALAKVALGSGKIELARKHAEAAIALAPQAPGPYDTLACVQYEENPESGGVDAAERAVALKSKEALSYMIAATVRARSSAGGLSAREARRTVNLLEKAINLRAGARVAYIHLVYYFEQLEGFREQDALFLQQGLTIFPEEVFLHAGLAQVLRSKGDKARSRELLAAVLRHADRLETGNLEFVHYLECRWLVEDANAEIAALADQEKYEEALAVLDRCLQHERLTWTAKQGLVALRERLAANVSWAAAGRALEKGDEGEARRLLEEIEASPRAPSHLKEQASQQLSHLRNAGANIQKVDTGT